MAWEIKSQSTEERVWVWYDIDGNEIDYAIELPDGTFQRYGEHVQMVEAPPVIEEKFALAEPDTAPVIQPPFKPKRRLGPVIALSSALSATLTAVAVHVWR